MDNLAPIILIRSINSTENFYGLRNTHLLKAHECNYQIFQLFSGKKNNHLNKGQNFSNKKNFISQLYPIKKISQLKIPTEAGKMKNAKINLFKGGSFEEIVFQQQELLYTLENKVIKKEQSDKQSDKGTNREKNILINPCRINWLIGLKDEVRRAFKIDKTQNYGKLTALNFRTAALSRQPRQPRTVPRSHFSSISDFDKLLEPAGFQKPLRGKTINLENIFRYNFCLKPSSKKNGYESNMHFLKIRLSITIGRNKSKFQILQQPNAAINPNITLFCPDLAMEIRKINLSIK